MEFAARWKTLDIRFEAYGKDIADSVRVNDRICQEILNYPPPYHAQYELFLAKGGKRFSKSAGTVFTPQVWFRYGSPQSLNLLMLKRFIGTRAISVKDIPQYMNEFDELEDIYFGHKKIENEKELAKLKGLYEYLWWLDPPKQVSVHAPYNLLVYLAKVAPKGSENQYIVEKLREYRYLKEKEELTQDLKERINYALNWTQDFKEIKETTLTLSSEERQAIEELTKILQTETDADQIQGSVFNIARKHKIQPGQFFKTLYIILLGTPTGPRLGPYLVAMGRKNVFDALERALKK